MDDVSVYSASEPRPEVELDELPNANIEQDRERLLPQPVKLPIPTGPSDKQRARHNLITHADFGAWCPHCVAGKAADVAHRRQNKHENPEVPVLQLADQCFSRGGQLVDDESKHATFSQVRTCHLGSQ